MTSTLPQFVRDLLASCPTAGTGVHGWLYRVARQLHAHYSDKSEMARLLEAACHGCGRHVSQTEIQEAIANSEGVAWHPGSKGSTVSRSAKWPSVNKEQREAIVRDNGGLADLWELSPIRIEDSHPRTEEIIDRLFPANSLLCVGQSDCDFDTMPREDWRGVLTTKQLIVPSPMTARVGRRKKDGKLSKHTLDNTGERRFLVCEFDTGSVDQHAALLIHLAGYAPLVCAVHSGSKSLHGWFFVAGQPEEKVLRFFRYAVSLGADDATWSRCQFVRMPDGTRDNGNQQTVFFLNFKPLEAAR